MNGNGVRAVEVGCQLRRVSKSEFFLNFSFTYSRQHKTKQVNEIGRRLRPRS